MVSVPEGLSVAAGVLLVSAAALSGNDGVSALLAAAGLVVGAVPVALALRRDRATQLACAVGAFWLVNAAVLGSLPSPGDAGAVADWASTEGRGLLALYAIAVGSSFTSRAAVASMLRLLVVVVGLTLVVGFVSHWFHVGPPLFDHRSRRLFHGLTSSHHVAGFLGAALVLIVVAVPGLLRRNVRVATAAVGLLAIALSGSRSSLVGLAVGVVVVLAHLLDRRRFVVLVLALAAATALLLVPVPRFRETVEIVTRPEFVSDAAAAFDDGTKQGARRLSESTVEANMLIRFALWGEQFDVIRSSPLIGIGRYRGNDENLEMWGLDGVLYVAIDGDRSPVGQPHNMYLLLLGETGLIGLVLFAAPYAVAVGRTRRPASGSVAAEPDPWAPVGSGRWLRRDASASLGPNEWRALARGALAVGLTIGLFSAALMTTGLGLVVNLVVFGAAAAQVDALRSSQPEADEVSS